MTVHTPSVPQLCKPRPTTPLRLAYLTTKFPTLSETFIYEELLALYEHGVDLHFFAFYDTGKHSHSFVQPLCDAVVYVSSIFSRAHLAAHWHYARTCSDPYRSTLVRIMKETWRTPSILSKSLYAFCKGVALARILEADGNLPHHLHAHWATMPATAAMVVGQLLDIPFSFTAHAWDIFKEQAMLPSKLFAANFTVTISEYNRQYLSQICPAAADRIYVVRCGVNLTRFPYRNEYPSVGPPHILSVSRLTEKKGLPRVVEACAHLRDREIDFVCTIVGDGPQRAALQQLVVTHGLQNVVKLTGGLLQTELHGLWQAAHVFVLPCTITKNGNRDGIPIVLMEAMALGVPVISTTVSGIPELVEDGVNGLLVPPDDANALSLAIARLLSEPKLAARLARKGRRRVEREYDVVRNTKKKAHLFEMTLGDSPLEAA